MYETKGPGFVKVKGPLALVLAGVAINLILFFWFIYFTIKIAAHVEAWPF